MTVWRTINNWTYEINDLDQSASSFEQYSTFIELWQSKRVGDAIPSWRDFELKDFALWYGWVTVFDLSVKENLEIRARLWGTQVTDFLGYDKTGKLMGTPEDGFDQNDFEFYLTLMQEKKIGLRAGPMFWKERHLTNLSFIGLPLSSDGTNVDKLLSLVVPS